MRRASAATGRRCCYLKGMSEPTVIEFKDQTPRAATLDAPGLLRNGRLPSDGPMSVNIPGVVAGLDYLYTKYSKQDSVSWADLVAPAIKYAEEGFVLDATLPSSVAEGRQSFQKYTALVADLPAERTGAARRANGSSTAITRATLRTIASEGAQAFYRGSIAQAHCRRHAGQRRADHGSRPGAVSRDRAQARVRPLSRSRAVHRRSAGERRRVALIEALQILGNYGPRPRATAARDADYLHYLIESWKARDRIARIADPAQWAVDYDEHLQASHAAELFARIRRD